MTIAVETRAGRIAGAAEGGLAVFRGIPYARPPVDGARWAPPQAMAPWPGLREARHFGAPAPQPQTPGMLILDVGADQSEDCLTLNVWTPAADGGRRPVMVWLHGGAFLIGAGSQGLYDGQHLARRGDVVVVTLNYRLGALGFLRLAEATRGAVASSGNEGLLDQIAALSWVRDNIAAFGGDPGNVTVFGESAGAMAVVALMAMPAAEGLFHKAIAQSGAGHASRSLMDAERLAQAFCRLLGIAPSDAAALRNLSPQRMIDIAPALGLKVLQGAEGLQGEIMTYQPVQDGAHLAGLPYDLIRQGRAQRVPLLIGTTSEEMKLFPIQSPDWDERALARRLATLMPVSSGEGVIEAYRSLMPGADARALYFAIETDRIFRLPALRLAEAQAARRLPAYLYEFTWGSPALGGLFGACHAIDLGFTFGTAGIGPFAAFFGSGPEAEALGRCMMDAWIAFARTGNPSTPALGAWAPYGTAVRSTMMLGSACALMAAPGEERRRLWDGVDDRDLG